MAHDPTAWESDLQERSARIRAKSASLVARIAAHQNRVREHVELLNTQQPGPDAANTAQRQAIRSPPASTSDDQIAAAKASVAEWRRKHHEALAEGDKAKADAKAQADARSAAEQRAADLEEGARAGAVAEQELTRLRRQLAEKHDENQRLQRQLEELRAQQDDALVAARREWEAELQATRGEVEEGEPPPQVSRERRGEQRPREPAPDAAESGTRVKPSQDGDPSQDGQPDQPHGQSDDPDKLAKPAKSPKGSASPKGGMLRRLSISMGASELPVKEIPEAADAAAEHLESAEHAIKGIAVTRTMLAKKVLLMAGAAPAQVSEATEQVQELQQELSQLELDFREALLRLPEEDRPALNDKLLAAVANAEQEAEDLEAQERLRAADAVARLMGIMEEEDEDEQQSAAVAIQAAFRGGVARKQLVAASMEAPESPRRKVVESIDEGGDQSRLSERDLLASTQLLAELDDQLLQKLAALSQTQVYRHQEHITREGEISDEMFFISRGSAEEIKSGEAMRVYETGEHFGEDCLLSSSRRTSSVKAFGDTCCIKLRRADIDELDEDSAADVRARLQQYLSATIRVNRSTLSERMQRIQDAMAEDEDAEDGDAIVRQTMMEAISFGAGSSAETPTDETDETQSGHWSHDDEHAVIIQRRANFLAGVPLFTSMTAGELEAIAEVIHDEEYEDEPIITEGDEGDSMYVLKDGAAAAEKNGQTVKSYVAGDFFGELALVGSGRRKATVQAVGPVECLRLGREPFHELVGTCTSVRELLDGSQREYAASRIQASFRGWTARHELIANELSAEGGDAEAPVSRSLFLQNVPLFKSMTSEELAAIADVMAEDYYEDEPIVEEGEEGDSMFVLRTGSAVVSKQGRTVTTYHAGDHFGELVLLSGGRRKASVEAVGAVECLRLGREPFHELVGRCAHVRELLDESQGLYAAERIQSAFRGWSVRRSGVRTKRAVKHFSSKFNLGDMRVEEIAAAMRSLGLSRCVAAVQKAQTDGEALRSSFPSTRDTVFSAAGPLGITWRKSKDAKTGKEDASVKATKPGSQAESLAPGLVLSAIDGIGLQVSSYEEIIARIRKAGRPVTLSFVHSSQWNDLCDSLEMEQDERALLGNWVRGMMKREAKSAPPASPVKPPSRLRRLSVIARGSSESPRTQPSDGKASKKKARLLIPKIIEARTRLEDGIAKKTIQEITELQEKLSSVEDSFRRDLSGLTDSQRRAMEDELVAAVAKAERDAKDAAVRERQDASDAVARMMGMLSSEEDSDDGADERETKEQRLEPEPEPEPEPVEPVPEEDEEEEAEGREEEQDGQAVEEVCVATFDRPGPLGVTWMASTVRGREVPVVKRTKEGSAALKAGVEPGMVLEKVSGVSVDIIGSYKDVIEVIKTTRPLTLAMSASVD